jgi:hypothetical protein
MVEIIHRRRRARKVKDKVQGTIYVYVIDHVVVDELKPRMFQKMGYVVGTARDEVVHAYNFKALCQELIAEMRTNKARTPRYQNAHWRYFKFIPTVEK